MSRLRCLGIRNLCRFYCNQTPRTRIKQGKRIRLGLGIVKKAGAAVLAIGVLLASPITGIWATPEQIHERKLMIAIDDGTGDAQLFVEMDDSDAAVARVPRRPGDSQVPAGKTNDSGGVMIVSGSMIDDRTRDCIRSILSSSGHGGEVVFMNHQEASESLSEFRDAADANEPHRIKVISKEISATN